jgi:hypothetical protein
MQGIAKMQNGLTISAQIYHTPAKIKNTQIAQSKN